MDTISVVIPVYNVQKFLVRCLESVLKQTYKKLEIILVNDGSTDDCSNICDYYGTVDSRIKVIHQANQGLSGARNTGIRYATGKYITFIDSDDWIEENYILYLYELLTTHEADVSQCAFRYVNDSGHIYNVVKDTGRQVVMNRKEALANLLLANDLITSAWGKLYKIEFFKSRIYPIGKLYEDIPVTYDIILHSHKVVYGDKAYYNYYYNSESISKMKFQPSRLDALEFTEMSIKKVLLEFPMLKEETDIALFRINLGIFLSFDKGQVEYQEIQEKVFFNMKMYRYAVLLNPKVKWREKVKACSTFFGKNIVYRLLKK
ncbi:glycosyltransferase family 2 protein [Aerococcaceae bacterium zg-ZUI334]|uniref:glycosyltransferase family 2 protein n=1 Tax=Aerococcaceae bacterium zg-252 TaxID=2796928 RepID=UPI001BA369BF|nr:glycosyltransferase family 2 protein [Aerococcaceae bacterium zg-ZUI334]